LTQRPPKPTLYPYTTLFRSLKMLNGLTLDDWKWNAEQFNKLGEQVKKAGLQLGYHNHNFEFKKIGDTTGYDEFLRLTDPKLVALDRKSTRLNSSHGSISYAV